MPPLPSARRACSRCKARPYVWVHHGRGYCDTCYDTVGAPKKGQTRFGLRYQATDGGRWDAGFTSRGGDCVTRAFAIFTNTPYKAAAKLIGAAKRKLGRRGTPLGGCPHAALTGVYSRAGMTVHNPDGTVAKVFRTVRGMLNFKLDPDRTPISMAQAAERFGDCVVDLRWRPKGGWKEKMHYAAIIDGVVYDSWDSRMGGAAVHAVWTPKAKPVQQVKPRILPMKPKPATPKPAPAPRPFAAVELPVAKLTNVQLKKLADSTVPNSPTARTLAAEIERRQALRKQRGRVTLSGTLKAAAQLLTLPPGTLAYRDAQRYLRKGLPTDALTALDTARKDLDKAQWHCDAAAVAKRRNELKTWTRKALDAC